MSAMDQNTMVYVAQLCAQTEKNICPSCFAAQRRKKYCTNMVVIEDNGPKLACCWLGDKNEITPEAFAKKVEKMKRRGE